MMNSKRIRRIKKRQADADAFAHFRSYVSADSIQNVKTADSLSPFMPPISFSGWRFKHIPAPLGKHRGIRSAWRLARLKKFMQDGGILVLVGHCRTGKTTMLEKMMPSHGQIIENFKRQLSRDGSDEPARISIDEVPAGIFAIDEAWNHNRDDILRALDVAVERKTGLALVFQQAELFRASELAPYLAKQKVLFLELKPAAVRSTPSFRALTAGTGAWSGN